MDLLYYQFGSERPQSFFRTGKTVGHTEKSPRVAGRAPGTPVTLSKSVQSHPFYGGGGREKERAFTDPWWPVLYFFLCAFVLNIFVIEFIRSFIHSFFIQ